MPVHVTCRCGRLVVVPDERAGGQVRCPRCHQLLRVHGQPQSEADADAPSTEPAADVPLIAPHTPRETAARADRNRRINAVYWLAVALVGTALASIAPVLVLLVQADREQLTGRLEPWAYGVVFLAMLQLAYVVYVVQIPDWSTVRVISILTLLHATAYAALMGMRLLAAPGNAVIRTLGLEASRFTAGQQAGWCLVMVLLYGTLSYVAGRFAGRWRIRAAGRT